MQLSLKIGHLKHAYWPRPNDDDDDDDDYYYYYYYYHYYYDNDDEYGHEELLRIIVNIKEKYKINCPIFSLFPNFSVRNENPTIK
jgi:hypothetical protein